MTLSILDKKDDQEVYSFVFLSGAPTSPSNFKVTYQTPNTATITWDAPCDDGGSPVIQYLLEKQEPGKSRWDLLTVLPADATECELENMAAGKDYKLRITAENKHGRSDPRELAQPIRVKGSQKGQSRDNPHRSPCKTKRQYLLTLLVSRDCILALQSIIVSLLYTGSTDHTHSVL